MWAVIVLIPDHCLSVYFDVHSSKKKGVFFIIGKDRRTFPVKRPLKYIIFSLI